MRTEPVVVAVLVLVSSLGGVPAAAADQSADATLTVSVVTESGAGVGGATINATWDGGQTVVETAGNGKAFVDVPEGADVSLSVESDEYIRNLPRVVEDASTREVTVEVAPKGKLTVAVNDQQGSVENARVRVQTDQGTVVTGRTSADGTFTTPDIEQGEYAVELFKAGYYRNLTRQTVGESTLFDVSMRRGTTNVQFEVVDDNFSPPQTVSEARVEIKDIGTQRLTAGTVTFTLPVNTRYTVTARQDGYQSNETTIFVRESGEARTLVINREPRLDLSVASGRVVVGETVQVTVRSAYDERVEGVTIEVNGESVATTGPDGTADVPVESAGEVTIVASANGLTSNETVIQGIATATESEGTDESTATAADDGLSSDDLPIDVDQPGFTPVAAVVALLAVALLARRRR
jgi:PGF-CTERM protein